MKLNPIEKIGLVGVVLCLLAMACRAEEFTNTALTLSGMPPLDKKLYQRTQQYSFIRHAHLADWLAADQGMLVLTALGETYQLHKVASPLGAREQWTFWSDGIAAARVQPSSPSPLIAYTKDSGGNENFQLFLLNSEKGDSVALTAENSRTSDFIWSHDGSTLYFSNNARNGTDFDVYAYELATQKASRIFEGLGSFTVAAVAHANRSLVLKQFISVNESRLSLLDLSTGRTEALRALSGVIAYGDVAFDKDDNSLYLIHSGGGDFRRLSEYSISDQRVIKTIAAPNWDVSRLIYHSGRHQLAYTVNEDGADKVYFYSLEESKSLAIDLAARSVISRMAFSADGRSIAFSLSTANTATDVNVYHLETKQWQRWTKSERGGLPDHAFQSPELIHFPTFDHDKGKPRTIPAWVYKPRAREQTDVLKRPVVINIHGGPEGQAKAKFNSTAQFVMNELDMIYIEPNVRGSTGYGTSFQNLDNGFLREDAVKDIGMLLDWIATQEDMDSERVLVTGGSYGGYMVLASLMHFSDRLKGGIDVVGISHFSTFLKNTSDYRRDFRRAEYGDERDPEMRKFHDEIAPLNHVEEISAPVFIVQGKNDPRVALSESEQMVHRLREKGGVVWYLVANDEGHGFRKKTNRTVYQTYAYQFIKQLLQDKTP